MACRCRALADFWKLPLLWQALLPAAPCPCHRGSPRNRKPEVALPKPSTPAGYFLPATGLTRHQPGGGNPSGLNTLCRPCLRKTDSSLVLPDHHSQSPSRENKQGSCCHGGDPAPPCICGDGAFSSPTANQPRRIVPPLANTSQIAPLEKPSLWVKELSFLELLC